MTVTTGLDETRTRAQFDSHYNYIARAHGRRPTFDEMVRHTDLPAASVAFHMERRRRKRIPKPYPRAKVKPELKPFPTDGPQVPCVRQNCGRTMPLILRTRNRRKYCSDACKDEAFREKQRSEHTQPTFKGD